MTGIYDRDRLRAVLVVHQRQSTDRCLCGWGGLGESHSAHVADMYEAPAPACTSCGDDPPRGGMCHRCGRMAQTWPEEPTTVRVLLHGCDDSTEFDFTPPPGIPPTVVADILQHLAEASQDASAYSCMPTMTWQQTPPQERR